MPILLIDYTELHDVCLSLMESDNKRCRKVYQRLLVAIDRQNFSGKHLIPDWLKDGVSREKVSRMDYEKRQHRG